MLRQYPDDLPPWSVSKRGYTDVEKPPPLMEITPTEKPLDDTAR